MECLTANSRLDVGSASPDTNPGGGCGYDVRRNRMKANSSAVYLGESMAYLNGNDPLVTVMETKHPMKNDSINPGYRQRQGFR